MTELLTATFIILLAAISPGPDFVLVVKNSLLHGRKTGMYSALGVSCSLLIHSSYCIFGLALIISQSLLLFSIVKYLGAVYLIYIGLRSLFIKHKVTSVSQIEAHNVQYTLTPTHAFIQGFLGNLLNPKAILFILSFFTIIINPSISWVGKVSLGFEIALIHWLWFSWLSIIITYQYVKARLDNIQHYVIRMMGVLLIGFGARSAHYKFRMKVKC
jgi:RhtB (resistance to homoserine/threonine) family protein